MKRITSILLCTVLIFSCLAGCGKKETGKPDALSTAYYVYAKQAIEIIDEYLTFSCSAKTAYNNLEDLENRASLPDTTSDLDTYKDLIVKSHVTIAQMKLIKPDYDEVLKVRDELAADINEPAFLQK